MKHLHKVLCSSIMSLCILLVSSFSVLGETHSKKPEPVQHRSPYIYTVDTAAHMNAYGFDVPTSGYTYYTLFNHVTVTNVYTSSGILIGKSNAIIARARENTPDSSGYYYETFFVRSQMEPIVTHVGNEYYRGINKKNEVKFYLSAAQQYINYAPTATMPQSTSTWNVTFGGNASTTNVFGFSISTGFSSTTQDTCFTVSASYNSANRCNDIAYNYSPVRSLHVIGNTSANRAINVWCAQTHRCFYAFTYRSLPGETILVSYPTTFTYAITPGSSWNGSCDEVSIYEFSQSVGEQYVT